MKIADVALEGRYVRLEPLALQHVEALVAASAVDPSLYQWSPVPQGKIQTINYIETALAWKYSDSALPFAILRQKDGAIIGSTRFWNIEFWQWPEGHPWQGRGTPDACEIGYTWFTRPAIRTGANTESKLLMLTHAFESWKTFRVCFHTDVRNNRSRAALERIGGRFEGILRSHRLAADLIPRDSARYSVLIDEWPSVKAKLQGLLT